MLALKTYPIIRPPDSRLQTPPSTNEQAAGLWPGPAACDGFKKSSGLLIVFFRQQRQITKRSNGILIIRNGS